MVEGRAQSFIILFGQVDPAMDTPMGRAPAQMIRKIMWAESMALWRDGSLTVENHLPGSSGTLPKEEGRGRWEVAEFLHLQQRLARAHSRRKGRAAPGASDPPLGCPGMSDPGFDDS